MSAMERDRRVKALVESLFAKAAQQAGQVKSGVQPDMRSLFNTTTWGFREIVLVIAVARLLDPQFRASTGFYGCNPRALYERCIRPLLRELGVPHRQSGPLNVAKAAAGINEEWAAQRRPAPVAAAAVRLVGRIEQMSPQELQHFAVALCGMFLREASRIAELTVLVPPESDIGLLYETCCALVQGVPDAGNTPQRIVGLLLQTYHAALGTGVAVMGGEDRASVTSTTSKKAGDIVEAGGGGLIIRVYEVTVKPFGESRMQESSSSLVAYNEATGQQVGEVVVLCREDDCPSKLDGGQTEEGYYGQREYQGVVYQFFDLFQWLAGQLVRMPAAARLGFWQHLQEYVSEPGTAEKVKLLWAELQRDELSRE